MLCVLGLVGAIVVADQRQTRAREQLFDGFAGRAGARLLESREFLSNRLHGASLVYRGLRLDIEQVTSGGKHPVFHLQATLELESRNPDGLRVEVYPERFSSTLGKLLGMQDIEIGVPGFDERYILKSNDPRRLEAFLDASTRDAIDRLYRLFPQEDVYLHLDASRLRIKRLHLVAQEGELDTFFQACLLAIDGALDTLEGGRRLGSGAPSEGMAFLPAGGREAGAAQDGLGADPGSEGIHFLEEEPCSLPETRCPVCGEETEGHVAFTCTHCGTGHHPECWDLNQHCGSFGCRNDRYHQG